MNTEPTGPTEPTEPTEPVTLPVTVVVASRDRPVSLGVTLDAVTATLRPGDELVVVDSASAGAATMAVARHAATTAKAAGADATVVRCETPGASRARNAGARAACNAVIAFTDDDCLPRRDWVSSVAAAFAAQPDLGFLTGAVVAEADGSSPRTGLVLSVTDELGPVPFPPLPTPLSTESIDRAPAVGHGANMAWRRGALDRIGGFDEVMGPGAPLRAAEDQDAFWRARTNGVTGLFAADVVVRHRQWRHRRAQLDAVYGYGVGAGALWAKRSRVVLGADLDPDGARERLRTQVLGSRAGRKVLRGLVWDDGAGAVYRKLREGYELGALAEGVRWAGALVGARRAWGLAVVDGHFVAAGTGVASTGIAVGTGVAPTCVAGRV